ncbi:MAG TPA: S26 family signal peptidase [Candidatus Saccharimonadales bacterium]
MRRPFLLRRVVGESMMPTLRHGQLLLIRRGKFEIADVVLLLHEGVEKVKRVAEIDGERVFVLGDNPLASTDSRHFGWLSGANVRGKVVWPRMTRVR